MKIEGDSVIFSSGKTRDANRGIIGLSPDFEVTEGYDGSFYSDQEHEDWRNAEDKLTDADMIELADYMISRWAQYREQIGSKEL